ncbi:MAG: hypothetical protein MZV63_30160 [Marinilabiliales bacterium]|nr:hypothetical protein [Marinilabiliales bacterium]
MTAIQLVGVNRARSATIEIFLENGKIAEIYQNQSPDGILDPPLKKPETDRRLDGYRWHPDLRPVRQTVAIPDEKTAVELTEPAN